MIPTYSRTGETHLFQGDCRRRRMARRPDGRWELHFRLCMGSSGTRKFRRVVPAALGCPVIFGSNLPILRADDAESDLLFRPASGGSIGQCHASNHIGPSTVSELCVLREWRVHHLGPGAGERGAIGDLPRHLVGSSRLCPWFRSGDDPPGMIGSGDTPESVRN